MKKKPISIFLTVVILLSTMGGAIGYNSYIWQQEYDHGSCHGGPPEDGEGNYGDYSVTSQGNITIVDVNPDIITVGMEFTVIFEIRNFTEVLEYSPGDPRYHVNLTGRDNRTMVGFSKLMGDNAEFMRDLDAAPMFHSANLNSTGGASVTGGYHSYDLEFKLRAPFAGGVYELVLVAVNGVNDTDGIEAGFIICLGSIMITVYTRAPAGTISAASDDDDDDDDAEGAISGYILIITLATIFSISAVLILSMKKRMKNKSRNV